MCTNNKKRKNSKQTNKKIKINKLKYYIKIDVKISKKP